MRQQLLFPIPALGFTNIGGEPARPKSCVALSNVEFSLEAGSDYPTALLLIFWLFPRAECNGLGGSEYKLEGLDVTASWKKVTLVSWEALVVASLLWIRSAMASGDQRSASDTFPGHWPEDIGCIGMGICPVGILISGPELKLL